MPTKDELEQELAAARDRIAALEAGAPAAPAAPPRPQRPTDADGKPVLSSGELDDLRNAGVTTSPFNGEALDAITEGVEPANPAALAAAKKAHAAKQTAAGADSPAAE